MRLFLFATICPSQTKILEGGTKDEMRIFEALVHGSWPKLSTHALEKCFENPHFIFCSSFQNLRLGIIQLLATKHGSRVWSPVSRATMVAVDASSMEPFKSAYVCCTSRYVCTVVGVGNTANTANTGLGSAPRYGEQKLRAILPLPNKDFGRMNKRGNEDCQSTFEGSEYSIWAMFH